MLSRTSIIASGAPARVSMISTSSGFCSAAPFDLQPHLDDGLADVIGDGGLDGFVRQENKSEYVAPAFRRARHATSKFFPYTDVQRIAVVFVARQDPRDAIGLVVLRAG